MVGYQIRECKFSKNLKFLKDLQAFDHFPKKQADEEGSSRKRTETNKRGEEGQNFNIFVDVSFVQPLWQFKFLFNCTKTMSIQLGRSQKRNKSSLIEILRLPTNLAFFV